MLTELQTSGEIKQLNKLSLILNYQYCCNECVFYFRMNTSDEWPDTTVPKNETRHMQWEHVWREGGHERKYGSGGKSDSRVLNKRGGCEGLER